MGRDVADWAIEFLLATCLIAVGSILVAWHLRRPREASPRWHQWSWLAVLALGWVVIDVAVEVPWYAPPANETILAFDGEDAGDWDAASAGEAVTELAERADAEVGAVAGSASPPSSPGPAAAAERPRKMRWSWQRAWLAIWIGGMACLAAVAVTGYGLLLVALRRARPADARWQGPWRRLLREAGVRRAIPLLEHPTLGPMLCRRPSGHAVVVPSLGWSALSAEERAAVLKHELAHYRQRDPWKSLLVRILAWPHWFNPFAWWAVRRYEEAGEWACDASVGRQDPLQAPALARALLKLVDQTPQLGVSTARGARLSLRLQRLLHPSRREVSIMRCWGIGLLLAVLGLCGATRIQLVAQESEESGERHEASWPDQVSGLAAGLAETNDPLLQELRAALGTEAGRIVMRDRVAHLSEMLRDEARDEALPDFLNAHFEEVEGKLVLRDDQQEFRERLTRAAAAFNEDVAQMTPVLVEHAERISGENEVDRLVARFLQEERAAAVLYIQELRQRVRPDDRLIADRLGQLFARNDDGKYVVRAGRRPEAEAMLARGRRAGKALDLLEEELAAWSADIAPIDPLHERLQEAFANPKFAVFIGAMTFDGDDGSVEERLEHFFLELEEMTRDTGDGLVLRDEVRDELERILDHHARLSRVAARLREPLREFADQIDTSGELEAGWAELLRSEGTALRLAEDFELAAADPGQAAAYLLGEILGEDEDGNLVVQHENPEEVAEFFQHLFRMQREMRRRGRSLDNLSDRLADEELRQQLQTIGGRFVLLQTIRQSVPDDQVNGLRVWIEEHFEETAVGLVPRDHAVEEIHAFLEDVAAVQRELENDDF